MRPHLESVRHPPAPAAELDDLRRMNQSLAARLQAAQGSIAELNDLLERSIARSNALVLETEISSLMLEEIFNASRDAIWVLDRDFRIVRINSQMARLIGQERHQLIGQVCSQVIGLPVCGSPGCPMAGVRQGKRSSSLATDVEVDFAASGRLSCVLSASIFLDPCAEVLGIVEAFTDITARKKAELALRDANQELESLSRTDGLTGLANRRRFDEVLEAEWKRLRRDGQPLSVLLGDVDFFKRYNDTYGHQAGDHCLSRVARAIAGTLRRSPDLAARYGGEEFVVVLPSTDERGARHVAELVRAEVEGLRLPHAASDVAGHVTISMGIATLVPEEAVSPEALTRLADQALYRAKEQGRNRVVSATAASPEGPARGH